MAVIEVSKVSSHPRSALWAVVADFGNIARWNSGVNASRTTTAQAEGLGAGRVCELPGGVRLDERIVAWEPESRLVVAIDEVTRLPVASAEVTFTLSDTGDGGDVGLGVHYEYVPAGVAGRLAVPVISAGLRRGFVGFLEDWDAAAAALPATV